MWPYVNIRHLNTNLLREADSLILSLKRAGICLPQGYVAASGVLLETFSLLMMVLEIPSNTCVWLRDECSL